MGGVRRHPPGREPVSDVDDVGIDDLLADPGEAPADYPVGPEPPTRREWRALTLVFGAGLVAFALVWGVLLALPDAGSGGTSKVAALATPSSMPTRPSHSAAPTPTGTHSSATPSPPTAVTPTPGPVTGTAYRGPVTASTVADATATCQDGPSRNGSGQTVTFEAALAVDGNPATAWRCAGDATGERLTLNLDAREPVAEVGLVPGWAQTDAANGKDRYAEDRRVATARWTFDNGAYVEQDLDTDPGHRDMQTLSIPPVLTETVTLEILATTDGQKDATPVSEVTVAQRSSS